MLFLGVIRYEQYYDELVAYGDFPPFGALRHHLCHGVKRVTRFSGRCAPLRIVFPCHPAVRGHNKAPYNIPLICGSKVSTGCCPTACGGKVVAQPPKGERISSRRRRGLPVFPRANPGCKGFIHTGAAGAHHHPLNLLNPHARKGVSLKAQAPADGWAPPAAGRTPSLPQKKWSHALCTAPLYYIL